jgi:hypothetical protein
VAARSPRQLPPGKLLQFPRREKSRRSAPRDASRNLSDVNAVQKILTAIPKNVPLFPSILTRRRRLWSSSACDREFSLSLWLLPGLLLGDLLSRLQLHGNLNWNEWFRYSEILINDQTRTTSISLSRLALALFHTFQLGGYT